MCTPSAFSPAKRPCRAGCRRAQAIRPARTTGSAEEPRAAQSARTVGGCAAESRLRSQPGRWGMCRRVKAAQPARMMLATPQSQGLTASPDDLGCAAEPKTRSRLDDMGRAVKPKAYSQFGRSWMCREAKGAQPARMMLVVPQSPGPRSRPGRWGIHAGMSGVWAHGREPFLSRGHRMD